MPEENKYEEIEIENIKPLPLLRQQARVFETQNDAVNFFTDTPEFCVCVRDEWCKIFCEPSEADTCGLVVTGTDGRFICCCVC